MHCWQDRRNRFNHDWLKNSFIPALKKFLNLLDDKIEDQQFEQSFIESVLPKWESHRFEAFSLAEDFEHAMSPRVLFELPPLSQCDEETRKWLGERIHISWLAKHAVHALVEEAVSRARSADAAYNSLHNGLGSCANTVSVQALHPLRPFFAEFLQACHDLARAIERFPSDVKV